MDGRRQKNYRRSFGFAQDDRLFVLLNLFAWINMRRELQRTIRAQHSMNGGVAGFGGLEDGAQRDQMEYLGGRHEV